MASAPALAKPTPGEVATLYGEPAELHRCLVNGLQALALRLHLEVAEVIGVVKGARALATILSRSGPIITTFTHNIEHTHTLIVTLGDTPTVTCATLTHGPAYGTCIGSTEAV